MKSLLQVCLVLSVFGISEVALSHARLVTPAPRVNNDNIKEGGAPCGAVRTATPHTFKPGETITVTFEETIDHFGYFQLRFAQAADTGFENNVLVEVVDAQGDRGVKTAQITFPSIECDDCTLQLIQNMQDRAVPSNYYSCADIVLAAEVVVPPVDPPVTDGGTTTGGDVTTLSEENPKPEMAGCGMITASGSGPGGPWGFLMALIPLAFLIVLRRQQTV